MRALVVIGLVLALAPRAFADDCEAFLATYDQDPTAADGDAALYNAAVCFEEAKSIGAALMLYTKLISTYPRSRIAARAIARSAQAYARIAYYDRAAERLEEYARKYTGEKDAHDALSDAIYYRRALGDRAKVIADTDFFIRTFGARKPAEATAAKLALLQELDADPDAAIALLRDVLKSFKLDGDQAVTARVKLAELLWTKSCSVHAVDGLCVKLELDTKHKRCGARTIAQVVAVKRSALAKDALAMYREAIAASEHAQNLQPPTLYFVGRAKLALGDDELERMIEAEFPRRLDFDPASRTTKQDSLKRFDAWVKAETTLAQSAQQRYEAVFALKDATSSVAAAARIGQISETFWRALMIGQIPKDVRTGELTKYKLEAYCAAIDNVAEPLAAHTVEAFGVCLNKATELGIGGEWASLCWREGAVIAPDKFPPANELFGAGGLAAPVLALERL
jgi:tetratricopeptide (TPR) repeat protein